MKRILMIIMTIAILLMGSCGNNRLTTGAAMRALLNSDNYKSGMSIRTEETVNAQDRGGSNNNISQSLQIKGFYSF